MGSIPEGTADCTPKCRSHTHALQLAAATVRGSFQEIRAFSKWLCCNFTCVTDAYSRNMLHIAASCGKADVLLWLLEQCHADVDVKDLESGWTALHRSLFYGNLLCTKILLDHKASFQATDHEGFTPLEIVSKDRPSHISYSSSDPSEVYVWGSNLNFNLGLGNEQARSTPELVEIFRRDNISVSKVGMSKFRTVFMSNDGRLFSCGLGHGGRLGVGNGETFLLPKHIKSIDSRCVDFATAEDHMLILTDKGRIWSCGLNTYHQLGHIPPPKELLSPRPISNKFMSSLEAVGICAARYHSVIFTKNRIYTFGLNSGQLGHPRGERFQTCPREVSALNFTGCQLSHVAVSDCSTVCTTTKGEIYVLHQYQCRKIASKQLNISKINVTGGHLDSKWSVPGDSDLNDKDLTILLLMNSGKVFIWQESTQFIQRCVFLHTHQIIIKDFHLNLTSIGLVSSDGTSFVGYFTQGKTVKEDVPSPIKSRQSLIPLLDKEFCRLIRVKRVPFIHRGTSITSDLKGLNFAVIQSHPKTYLLELPTVSATQMLNEMRQLYKGSDFEDGICDVIIKTGKRKFPAHKYILAARSEFFRKKFNQNNAKEKEIAVDFIKDDVFEQILQFVYTNSCTLLMEAKENSLEMGEMKNFQPQFRFDKKASKQSKKVVGPLEELFKWTTETSIKLGISSLTEALKSCQVVGATIQKIHDFLPPNISFLPDDLIDLCDVCLRSCDGVDFHCHKCILVARVDYFSSMLRAGWSESSRIASLPFSARVLGAAINFIYTDDSTKLFQSDDTEFLCQVLVAADHMLISRLKEMCEVALVDMITLKNVTELLELSHVYRAVQLKATCMEYININLPALLEANCLNSLSNEAIEELSNSYKQATPGMCRRRLTPYNCGPTQEELEQISTEFPVDEDAEHYNAEGKIKSKRRFRTRKTSEEPEKNVSKPLEMVHVHPVSPSCFNFSTSLEDNHLSKTVSPVKNNEDTPVMKSPPFDGKWNVPNNSSNDVLGLRDIMLSEEQNSKTTTRVLIPGHLHRSSLSQKQRKQLTTKQQYTEEVSTSFETACSPPPSPWGIAGASRENPWNKMSPFGNNPVMEDIIRSEIHEQEGLQRIRTKSFDLINMEEKAIAELLLMYGAAECTEERITVERVVPDKIAVPLWVKQSNS